MSRAPWLLMLFIATAFAESVTMPPWPGGHGGPPGFPDVSGGRVAIVRMSDVREKAVGLPIVEPKLGEKLVDTEPDRVIIGDPDGWLADLDAYRGGVKPAAQVLANASIRLSSLAGTPFERMTLLGYLPAGGEPRGPWTAVQRLFVQPSGELLLLKEWDFGLDGGGVVMFEEMLNTRVGASRATLIVTRGRGVTQTAITWISGTRQFELIAICKLATGCAAPAEWRTIASSVPAAPVSRARGT